MIYANKSNSKTVSFRHFQMLVRKMISEVTHEYKRRCISVQAKYVHQLENCPKYERLLYNVAEVLQLID